METDWRLFHRWYVTNRFDGPATEAATWGILVQPHPAGRVSSAWKQYAKDWYRRMYAVLYEHLLLIQNTPRVLLSWFSQGEGKESDKAKHKGLLWPEVTLEGKQRLTHNTDKLISKVQIIVSLLKS